MHVGDPEKALGFRLAQFWPQQPFEQMEGGCACACLSPSLCNFAFQILGLHPKKLKSNAAILNIFVFIISGRQRDRKKEIDISPIHYFTPQMPAAARAG